MSARHLVVAGVLVGLTACAIGPDYERPQLPAPAEFRGVLSPQEATSFADQHWAEVFHDPELQQVIETALANNLDLKIAAARVEEFRGRARVARSYLGPNLSLGGNTTPSPGTAVSPFGAGGVSSAITPDRVGRPLASAGDGPRPAALTARIRKS